MSIIFVLIPIAVIFVIIGLYVFFWAVKSRQFDDLEKEGFSILFDEKEQKKTVAPKATENTPAEANSDLKHQ